MCDRNQIAVEIRQKQIELTPRGKSTVSDPLADTPSS